MNFVYVLKIRHSGGEDDVFVFNDIQKVADVVFEYFNMEDQRHRGLDGLQAYLMHDDIGYFDFWKEYVR